MYVCTQLTAPDAQGLQTCTNWQQYAPLFPDLSISQWSGLAIAMITVFAVAWGFKTLSTFIKES